MHNEEADHRSVSYKENSGGSNIKKTYVPELVL